MIRDPRIGIFYINVWTTLIPRSFLQERNLIGSPGIHFSVHREIFPPSRDRGRPEESDLPPSMCVLFSVTLVTQSLTSIRRYLVP